MKATWTWVFNFIFEYGDETCKLLHDVAERIFITNHIVLVAIAVRLSFVSVDHFFIFVLGAWKWPNRLRLGHWAIYSVNSMVRDYDLDSIQKLDTASPPLFFFFFPFSFQFELSKKASCTSLFSHQLPKTNFCINNLFIYFCIKSPIYIAFYSNNIDSQHSRLFEFSIIGAQSK